MSLTVERGQQAAAKKALSSDALYRQAQRMYGRTIAPYQGDAPRALGLAHLTMVNPKLLSAPTPTSDRRRGFMLATAAMAKVAGVTWQALDDPLTCAYVWGRDINADARNLYSTQSYYFPTVNDDFWKCAYLKHILGDSRFSIVWNTRDTTQDTVYDSLLYAVNNTARSLPGTTVVRQKKLVLLDCAYVFEMAKRGGGLRSSGYGIEPVLNKSNYQQVFE